MSATDLYTRTSNNSPQVVADPTDSRFMVLANRADAPFNCFLQLSGDAGQGWITAVPVPRLPEGVDACYGPEVAFDRKGRLYFLFVGLQDKGNSPVGAFLVYSDDRGRNFSPPKRILDRQRYQVRMVVDPTLGDRGRMHLVWLQPNADPPTGGLPSGSNPILSAFSDDGGATFSDPVEVSEPDRPRAVAPAVVVGSNHAVHVAYYDLRDDHRDYSGLSGPVWDGNWSLMLTTSHDGGVTFGPSVVVDSQIVPPERVMLIFTMPPPSVAADGDGVVAAAWHDARNGDWDAFLKTSADSGATWGELVRLNDDPVANGSYQYLPRLDVAPNGRIDAIFYDRRNNVENRGNDVYYTYSTDHGKTFAANTRVTTRFSDSLVGPEYAVASAEGLVEYGGRVGLMSQDSGAYAAWTDTRNTILASPAQDIFAARVSYPRPRGLPPGARALGVVLFLGALAGVVARSRRARPAAVEPNLGVAK